MGHWLGSWEREGYTQPEHGRGGGRAEGDRAARAGPFCWVAAYKRERESGLRLENRGGKRWEKKKFSFIQKQFSNLKSNSIEFGTKPFTL